MRQKDIWLVNLSPAQGAEQRGTRPAVIMSGNSLNDNLNLVIICPLSSKIKHYPGCIILRANKKTGLAADSEVLTFQIRAIDRERLERKLGEISDADLLALKAGLNDTLIY